MADPYQQAYAQAPPSYAPAPQYAPYATSYPPNPDEVRTVFITGFPSDVKERELNNLLRFLPGYEVIYSYVPTSSSSTAAHEDLTEARRALAGFTDALEKRPGIVWQAV